MELKVTIVECHDLTTGNSYVLGKLGKEEFRTTTHPHEHNPSWNITTDLAVWDVHQDVCFEVLHEGHIFPNRSLGTAKVSVAEVAAAPGRKIEV